MTPSSIIILTGKNHIEPFIDIIISASKSFLLLSDSYIDTKNTYKKFTSITELIDLCNNFATSVSGDILIIRDSHITGADIEELKRILHISERHSCVSPRGSKMGLLSIPFESSPNTKLSQNMAFNCYKAVAPYLPDYHIIPYPSSTCVLIRGNLIKKFGLFDNNCVSLDDAIVSWSLSVGQLGYSSIAANKTFISNEGIPYPNLSFSIKYPYINKLVENYKNLDFFILDKFSSLSVDDYYNKPKILLSMFALAPAYNGTAEHAFSLAKRLIKNYGNKYDFHILIMRENADFFKVHNDFDNVIYPENLKEIYHIGVTFIQIFNSQLLSLLNRHCLKIVSTVLDLILYRCPNLSVNMDMLAFKKSVYFSDGIITISNTVKDDLASAFPDKAVEINEKTTPIFIAKADRYETSSCLLPQIKFQKYFLIFGNHYEHKALNYVYPLLSNIDANFIIIGRNNKSKYKNIQTYSSGLLSYQFIDNLYKNCEALIFPSEYEGFGLPIINALSKGKAVIVNNTAINKELFDSFPQYQNKFIFFSFFMEIKKIVEGMVFITDIEPAPLTRTYEDVATETEKVLEKILALPVDFKKIFYRNDALSLDETIQNNVTLSIKNCRQALKSFIKEKYPTFFIRVKNIKKIFKN